MKKFLVLGVCAYFAVVSNALGQDLTLAPGETHIVEDDETYGRLEMGLDSTLIINAGTSITMSARSLNDGGTIMLNGGAFTVNERLDFGDDFGGYLEANSGTFDVLDLANRGEINNGWKLPDNAPNEDSFQTGVTIGDGELYVLPGAQMIIDRQAFVTFLPGGSGALILDEGGCDPLNPADTCLPGFTGDPLNVDNQWDPNQWLALGATPDFAGLGLFAPAGEEIIIERIAALNPEGDPTGFDTRITSVSLLSSSDDLFTWGERVPDGSWSNTGGWKKDGADTTDIPVINDVIGNRFADPAQVLSGTLRVNTADQGAWSLQVDSGATAVASDGKTLRIAENVTIDGGGKVEATSGGTLQVDVDLTVAAGGVLELNDGAVTVGRDTAVLGTVSFIGTGVDIDELSDADFDVDGDVDGDDFLLWQVGFGAMITSGATKMDGDFDDDGDVDGDDFLGWQANFPSTASGTPLSALTLQGGALANVEVSSSGLLRTDGDVTVGQLTMNATSLLEKQGNGTLFLEQSGGASALAVGSELRLKKGALVALNDSTNNALGEATVDLDGGELVLSSTGSAVAFDSAVVVSSDSTIRATQSGTGALAGQTVTLGGTKGINASEGIVTLLTGEGYTLALAGDVSGSGRLDFGEGASVQVSGNVAPAGIGFTGDISNVSLSGGSIAPTSAYYFNPTNSTKEMTIPFDITGSREVVIGDKTNDDGSVGFTGALDHTGATRIQRGALRIGGADVAPTASNIVFDSASEFGAAAVVETTAATYTPMIGTAAGNVSWAGAGGFASRQGGAGTTVTLNGGTALDWDSASSGFNGKTLQLGSATANAKVELTNDISLGSAAERVIMVANNPDTNADIAEVSGDISSSGGTTDLLRINRNDGTPFRQTLLVLSGTNTFANTLRLDGSSVAADEGQGLPLSANLQFSSGNPGRETVLLTSGTFTRNVGLAAGEVFWNTEDDAAGDGDSEAGGFAARGGDLTVTLNGGSTIVWRNPDGFNNHDALQLGSQYADGVVTFTNNINAFGFDDDTMTEVQDQDRTISIFDNPDSPNDSVLMTGNITGVDGLRFAGNGRVVVNGNVDNTNEFRSLDGNVVVIFNGNQLNTNSGDVDVVSASSIYLNGTVNVGGDVQMGGNDDGPSIGGSGNVTLYDGPGSTFEVEDGGHFRPGPDVNAVGTLGVNLAGNSAEFGAGSMFLQPTSTYHMEFDNDGGLVHDSADLDAVESVGNGALAFEKEGEAGSEVGWNLDVSALGDLTGLVSGSGEYDLFTFTSKVDLFDYNADDESIDDAPILTGTGVITSAMVVSSSGDFDVSGASVMYDTGSGRVFVTGLTYIPGGGGSAIPEPTSCLLGVVAMIGLLACRRRDR